MKFEEVKITIEKYYRFKKKTSSMLVFFFCEDLSLLQTQECLSLGEKEIYLVVEKMNEIKTGGLHGFNL